MTSLVVMVVVCKHKTAYEVRISVWSSDVCSSDLERRRGFDGDLDAVADGFDRDDPADRIDMAGDDMPAKLVADLERAFEIQAAADVPHPGRGARDRFGARVDREPARGAVEIGRAHV